MLPVVYKTQLINVFRNRKWAVGLVSVSSVAVGFKQFKMAASMVGCCVSKVLSRLPNASRVHVKYASSSTSYTVLYVLLCYLLPVIVSPDNSNPRVEADRRGGAKRISFLGSGRPVLRNNGSDRIVGATGPKLSLGLTDQQ